MTASNRINQIWLHRNLHLRGCGSVCI